MSCAQVNREKEKATVILQTDLVAVSTAELRPIFLNLIKDGVTSLWLDMTAAKKIDSQGISILVASCNSLDAVHGELVLFGVSAPIVSLFQTLQLSRKFKINPA
ncbi:MAG: STAS domain-containing protein [Candidatus Riflebacteria bacterium]|nr:STAS domain-containing protein [Candidatus Riflebacteria bacterium]